MPFNGSGIFTRVHNWVTDKNATVPITASRMDAEDNGFAAGLTQCVTKNGESQPSANLPMAGFRHTTVGAATARLQYAQAAQVQDNAMAWGGTAGGTADALTLSLTPPLTAYAVGLKLIFIPALNNTGAATINVNALGAKGIKKGAGTTDLAANDLKAGKIAELFYDGTNFQVFVPDLATEVLQHVTTGFSDYASTTSAIPYDDTIPQIGEGAEFMTRAITPMNAGSTLVIDFTMQIGTNNNNRNITVALFRDAGANALAAWCVHNGEGNSVPATAQHRVVSGALTATTFRIRAGEESGTQINFNGDQTGRKYGGVAGSRMTITELL